jgi:hypothetical protein
MRSFVDLASLVGIAEAVPDRDRMIRARSSREDARARARVQRIRGYGINLIVWHALIRRVKIYCVAGKP